MTHYAFPPSPRPVLAISGTEALFPVRRIFCVGRNYAAHAREMGADDREPPFFFSKPADAVVNCPPSQTVTLPYPSATQDLHYEVELVAALADGGRNLTPEQGLAAVFGLGVGIDLTRRDLQNGFKAKGHPWDAAKGFDHSAPIGPLRPMPLEDSTLPGARIWLSCDGKIEQDGQIDDMIWSLGETIAQCSRFWALEAGDLIFTGTPEGVGPVLPGQTLEAGIDRVGTLSVKIGQPLSI
jgi:fumarylpyruvate hydrolase